MSKGCDYRKAERRGGGVRGADAKKARSHGPGLKSTTKEETDGWLDMRPGRGAKETTGFSAALR